MASEFFVGEPTDGLATPQAAAVDKKHECLRTCGSKRCKRDIKRDACAGMEGASCVSVLEPKLKTDPAKANEWLAHGKGDTEWLNQHGERNHARRFSDSVRLGLVAA